MDNKVKVLKIEMRIPLLEARPKDNASVVRKLKRQYRMLTGKDYVSVTPTEV